MKALFIKLKLKLKDKDKNKNKELSQIKELLHTEEPRAARRCHTLNGLHHGYKSGDRSTILNVSTRNATLVANAYLELGLESVFYDEEKSSRPIDIDTQERSRIVAMVCSDPLHPASPRKKS